MIRVLRELFDDIKDDVQGFSAVDAKTIASVLKEIAEVEDLIMNEGAAVDIVRVASLVKKMIQVPVTGDEAAVQKKLVASLNTLSVVATAFKQYFASMR